MNGSFFKNQSQMMKAIELSLPRVHLDSVDISVSAQ